MISKPEILAIAVAKAKELKLDHELVLAIIEVESNFNTMAHRFESAWIYFTSDADILRFAIHNSLTRQTERIDQQTSFGCGQVMGSVARELGYEGNLADLYDPNFGIHYACLKIKEVTEKYEFLDDAISAYNAGSPVKVGGLYRNQAYVDSVLKALSGKKWNLNPNKGL